jgi:hypothetical protein
MKLPIIHETETAMLSYLYDVVKPPKSIFFSLIYMPQKIPPIKNHTQVPVDNTLSLKCAFP